MASMKRPRLSAVLSLAQFRLRLTFMGLRDLVWVN